MARDVHKNVVFFYVAVDLEYMVSNAMMDGKNLERNGRGITEIFSWRD
jgi:hypothetical protein